MNFAQPCKFLLQAVKGLWYGGSNFLLKSSFLQHSNATVL